MMRQMAKKRKRRNKKLFRTVRKTIAAIIMIMAVVVAAIPVEQLGSTEARTVSRGNVLNFETLYDTYSSTHIDEEDAEMLSLYPEAEAATYVENDDQYAIIYSFTNNSGALEFAADYYVKKNEDNDKKGVIIGYAGDGNQNVEIDTSMCTEYFVITQAFVDALKNTFANEVYTAEFKVDAVNDAVSDRTFTLYVDGSTTGQTIVLPSSLKTTPNYSMTGRASGTLTVGTKDYYYSAGTDDFSAEYILKTKDSAYGCGYSARVTDISAYNTELNTLRNTVKQYVEAGICSSSQFADVQNAIDSLTLDYTELSTLSVSFSELALKDNITFIQDCIEKRFCMNSNSYYNLDGFTIEAVVDMRSVDAADKVIYVPICRSANNVSASVLEYVDDDGYIRLNEITVYGIANESFKGKDIRTITLSDRVEFIGTSAFEECENLSRVNLAYCKVVGNKAFKNCKYLENVTFSNYEDGLQIQNSGTLCAEAFYGCTALTKVNFSNSIKTIERGCFANSGLQEFYFQADNSSAITIWPFAFYNCSALKSVNAKNGFFPSDLQREVTIGMAAFAMADAVTGLSMTEFDFPITMKKFIQDTDYTVDPFGLREVFDNYDIAGVELGTTDTIGEIYYDYILGNRYDLNAVTFSANLGKGVTEVKIPDNTLYHCENLEKVTFGEVSYNGACSNVTFDAGGTGVNPDYDTDGDDEFLFQDILNSNFTVYGPGYYGAGTVQAYPRKATSVSQTAVSNFIPYVYLDGADEDALPQIELSYGPNGEYVATINVIDEAEKTATLTEFKRIDDTSRALISLTIPTQVGGYNIAKLGENCFDEIVNYIYELTFEDNASVELEIADGVFMGAENLARVYIGNSVKSISSKAFADCRKLENVYFTNPILTGDDWSEVIAIDDSAFRTNSQYLTFHGEIHEGYRPFELAMSEAGSEFNNEEFKNICYKTDAPTNLTVIRDNATGAATLVDYPHFEEIDLINAELVTALSSETNISDYSIVEKFMEKHGLADTSKYAGWEITHDEGEVTMNTLLIDIPEGVDSIDAKTFFLNDAGTHSNKPNFKYLEITYKETDMAPERVTLAREVNDSYNLSDIVSLYSNDQYASVKKSAGLFSGAFYEEGVAMIDTGVYFSFEESLGFNNQLYVEDAIEGNDLLTSINLGSVQSIPDYAFNSCENLLSVKIGPELTTMGKTPFSGCTKLTGIDAGSNPYFHSKNGIIYQLTSDSDTSTLSVVDKTPRPDTYYTIVQCLEIRGTEVAFPSSVSPSNDYAFSDASEIPVGAIAEEAFAYCKGIEKVDLSETYVSRIPDNCFRGSTNLDAVILPYATNYIGEGAFAETNADVYIMNPDCEIDNSFSKDYKGTIYGYKYSDGNNTEYSTVYEFYLANKNTMNIQFEEIGHILTFVSDSDTGNVIIETQSVQTGESGSRPIITPVKTGFNFVDWAWSYEDENGKTVIVQGEQAYQNVRENREIYAIFEPTNGVIADGTEYTLKISKGTEYSSGESSVSLLGGDKVMVVADAPATDEVFQYWSVEGTDKDGNAVDVSTCISDAHNKTIYVTMPNANVNLTANFAKVVTGGTGDGSGSGSGSGDGDGSGTDTVNKYTLTVNYGSGGGTYEAGKTVTITANDMGNSRFSKWTTTSSGVGFANTYAASTTITMPASDVTVTANFKASSSLEFDDEDDDDDDDSTSNRRPVGGSAGTNSNVTVTDKTTGTTQTNGDIISVNKDDISNKNVASTKVDGATDNFVVKVTDTENARILAEAALRSAYGSLDGIVYSPMDISLYDATGKNPILDSTGLDVTVTLPIPDDMIQYGGNVRVAAVDNGKLENLAVRFTTIDGIACVSFVPPHFSPYVIYVNTNNLVAGTITDATPETGDFIHPKWFIALGMACLSIFLFTTGDRRKKMNFA